MPIEQETSEITPQQMADLIYQQIGFLIPDPAPEIYLNIPKVKAEAKKGVAIYAVQLVLNANPHSNPFNSDQQSTMQFWMEVKSQLQKK